MQRITQLEWLLPVGVVGFLAGLMLYHLEHQLAGPVTAISLFAAFATIRMRD